MSKNTQMLLVLALIVGVIYLIVNRPYYIDSFVGERVSSKGKLVKSLPYGGPPSSTSSSSNGQLVNSLPYSGPFSPTSSSQRLNDYIIRPPTIPPPPSSPPPIPSIPINRKKCGPEFMHCDDIKKKKPLVAVLCKIPGFHCIHNKILY